jgi:hypothetical protein
MKKKLLLTALFLCTIVLSALAQKEYALAIVMADGSTTLYQLNEEPEMKMGENDFTIVTSSVSITYSDTEVGSFVFEEMEANAIAAKRVLSDVSVTLKGDVLVVEQPKSGVKIEVFAANGMKVKSAQSADKRMTVNLSSIPTGIYMVKVGNIQTFKFYKK